MVARRWSAPSAAGRSDPPCDRYQVPDLQPPFPVQVRFTTPFASRSIVKVLFAPAVTAFDTAVTLNVSCAEADTSTSPGFVPYDRPVLPSSACVSQER